MTANPLVAGPVNTTSPLSGTFLIEDCATIASGVKNGDWIEGGMGAFAAVGDAVALAVDPIGGAVAMGVGWLLDHMEPIKGWFNDLTGDAGEVAGFAATWDNISAHLSGVADGLTGSLGDLADERGAFIAAYGQFQMDSAEHVRAASQLASAMGVGMQLASTIVQIVHDITRDALSELVGSAVSAVAETAITLGFAAPVAIGQVATKAAALAGRIGKFVTRLLRSIRELLRHLGEVNRVLRSLRQALDGAFSAGSDAIRSVVRKADDVGSALPTPSPAVRAPNAPARTADDTFLDLVESGQAYAPGYRPDYADDVGTVVTFFDREITDLITGSPQPTLGRQGGVSFVTPVDDANLISSIEDAVIATGAAPRVEAAWRSGEQIFGLEIPADGLDLRAPTRLDAQDYVHYTEGGYTAIADGDLYRLNRTRELVVDGGIGMPSGTVLFELMPDGSRLVIGMFK